MLGSPPYSETQEIIGAILTFHDDTLTRASSVWSNFGLGVEPEALFEDLERGLFIVDQHRRITAFNRRAQEITGFPKEEALGRHCWEVLRADRCQEGCSLRATLEDGVPRVDQGVCILNKVGERLSLLVSTAPIKNKRDVVVGAVETFQSLGPALLPEEEPAPLPGEVEIIGQSPAIKKLLQMLPDVAASSAAVEHYHFFLCAFRTGMRLGELLALQWGDVDWHGKFVEVRRSYKLGRLTPTKTGRVRRVDMSDQLIEGLKELNAHRKRQALQEGRGEICETIFHRGGKHMEQNYIRRVFKRLLNRAGLREIRLHDIRHTFASLPLSDGASPVYLKEQLGHNSIQMTVDIYGHLIPSSNREMVNRLDMQPSATYPQPASKEKAHSLDIAPKTA